jgi:hypothetical protein
MAPGCDIGAGCCVACPGALAGLLAGLGRD